MKPNFSIDLPSDVPGSTRGGRLDPVAQSKAEKATSSPFGALQPPKAGKSLTGGRLERYIRSNLKIEDFIPDEWLLERVHGPKGKRGLELFCSAPPKDGYQRFLDKLGHRIGCRVAIRQGKFEVCQDAEARALIESALPKYCDLKEIYHHEGKKGPEYQVVVRRPPPRSTFKKTLRKLLQSSQVNIRALPEDRSGQQRAADRMFDGLYVQASRFTPLDMTHAPKREGAEIVAYGGCGKVEKSCFHLQMDGLNLLIDCGAGFDDVKAPALPKELVQKLDFVILSHAHGDHSGMIPWLYKNGCRAPLLASEATLLVSEQLLIDRVRLARRLGQHSFPYRGSSIERAMRNARVLEHDQSYSLSEQVKLSLHDSGHALGSSMVLVEGERRVLYTGDVGREGSHLLNDHRIPKAIDHLIIETTYGGDHHEDRGMIERRLISRMKQTLDEGGSVIVPAFALGRSQDVLLLLAQDGEFGKHGKYPVFVHGGLMRDMNRIFSSYASRSDQSFLRGENRELIERVLKPESEFFSPTSENDNLWKHWRPKVVVTTSGMCSGPAKYHLRGAVGHPGNLLMLVGYQAEGTLGRQLLDGAQRVKIDGKVRKVGMQVERFNLSAHADQRQLLQFVEGQSLKSVVAVHGEEEQAADFIEQVHRLSDTAVTTTAQVGHPISLY